MLAGWGSLASVCAIVWAAFVGKSAISDYRKQKIVDKEIDAADSALTAAYRAFDAIAQMQGRWMLAHEIHQAEQAFEEAGVKFDAMDEEMKSALVTRGVIYRRAEFFKSDFDAIFEAIPTTKVYFGQDAVDWLNEFPKARNRILSSADMLPMASQPHQQGREFAVKVRQNVFGAPADEDDPIRNMVSAAVAQLETILLPKLRPEKADLK
jgi:hypothetical protein